MDVRVGLWRKLSAEELMLLNCGVGEDSWESLGLQGDPTSPFWRRSALRFLWREWCWSWNSSTLATSCEELTHWTRLWCWEGLEAGGEGDTRGEMAGCHHWFDGRASEWTPGVGDGQGGLACCDSWGLKESDTTEGLNWTELNWNLIDYCWCCSVAMSCLSLCEPQDCSLPCSSIYDFSQARIVKWVSTSFSRGSCQPGVEPTSPPLVGVLFTTTPSEKLSINY